MKLPSLAFAATLSFCNMVFATPVNINTASADQIASALNGIGQNKAAAIVNYRQQHGPFNKAEEITYVKGIGSSILEKNRADILVK